MNYLVNVVSSCRDFYQELNSANLTGAIDVLVVQQPDGRLLSTAFHVRFGKMGVLRPGDLQKKVEVTVNGQLMPFYMRLDETGSAFFVEQEAATPTPQGEGRGLSGGAVGGARRASADEDEDTPTNSPRFEPVVGSSFGDWSDSNTGVAMATSKSDSDLLQADQSEEGVGDILTNKSVSSTADSAVAQSSDMMSQSKQDGSREEDGCMFELSDMEESTNATNGGVANANEDVGGRPASQDDEEVEPLLSNMSHSLPETYYPLSDSESYPRKLPKLARMVREDPTSVHSDTELEVATSRASLSLSLTDAPAPPPSSQDAGRADSFLSSMMKLFGGGRERKIDVEDGLYLEDLETVFLPPEERSQYFPNRMAALRQEVHGTLDAIKTTSVTSGDEGDSGVGGDRSPATRDVVSAPCSPAREHDQPKYLLSHHGNDETGVDSLIATFEGLQLSLCGGLKEGASAMSDDKFTKHLVSFEKFAEDPTLLTNPNLVVKIKGQYYNWQVAAPLLMSILVFHRPLPQVKVDKLVSTHMRKEERGRWGGWFRWGKRSNSTPAKVNEYRSKPIDPSPVLHEQMLSMSSDEGEWSEEMGAEQRKPPRHKSTKRKRNKSLYLSEEQLECLNLSVGVNEAEFSVTTRFQGTSKAACCIYLWKSTDKIIVSDIDGTITRSDVAGQILPMLGKDWSQAGVVDLFRGVADNGYKFVYLSARPIGYAPYTRNYLQWIRQGNGSLPGGPVFLAPLSVFKAFTKEVIEKKPEEFKIACLKDIRRLFPSDRNPFYAGFGNKTTDETSYKAVDIPTTQMYTINHRGELKNSFLTSFKSTYKSLKEYIDHMFPPLDAADQIDGVGAGDEFSSLNFWRTPFPAEVLQLPEDVV